jgi:hypothetical protein
MKLLQELSRIREAATMDVMMDTICKACEAAKCKGETYEQAVKNIAAEFRKLDKHDSSKMSDEALNDLIKSFYNQDKHLSANDNVTSYRDTNFSKGQGPGTTPGATDGIVNNRVNQMKEEDGVEPAPKRDLKAEAIGIATAWLKSNYKKYNLPLKVRRVPTSGKYIMTTVAANKGEDPKRVFLKVLDGEAKQVSSREWKMLDEADGSAAGGDMPGGNGSLDGQTQGGIPSGQPDPNNGPQGNEVATPPPNNKPPTQKTTTGPATRTIAKGGDFRVDLGQNEQISIIDGKGAIRLSMPFVIWKELTRQ